MHPGAFIHLHNGALDVRPAEEQTLSYNRRSILIIWLFAELKFLAPELQWKPKENKTSDTHTERRDSDFCFNLWVVRLQHLWILIQSRSAD